MTVYKRIALTMMFSIGMITIGVMCWRIVVTVQGTKPGFDFYFGLPTLALIVMLELWMSIIVACVPTLAPLMRTYVAPLVTKFSTGRTSGLDQPLPLPAVETIGAKRIRKKYFELGGSQDPLNTRSDDTTETELTSDFLTPVVVSSDKVNV